MRTKQGQILTNAILTLIVWSLVGLAVFGLLKWNDPASLLTEKHATELPTNLRTFAGIVAQIAATLAGFIFAALTLLLSLSHKELIQKMSTSGHLHVLLLRMVICICLCLILSVGGIIYVLIPQLENLHLYVAACMVLVVAISVGDVLRKLVLVFFFISPLPKTEPKTEVQTLYANEPQN